MKKLAALLFTVLFSTAFTCKMVIHSEKYDLKNGKAYFYDKTIKLILLIDPHSK